MSLCFFLIVDAHAANESVVYAFTSASGGMYPTGLISDTAGNLYGATEFTLNYGPGTMFELASKGSSYTFETIYTLPTAEDGEIINGFLARDSNGNLYGTTSTGGSYYKGSVFELSPNQEGGWTRTVLYSFANGADGGYPIGGVILDKAGNLYGTASFGGLLSECSGVGCGVAFELSPVPAGSWTETVLHSFAETEGALPSSRLVFGVNGILYGTTQAGGTSTNCQGSPANGCGTVFELKPSAAGWAEKTLHSFDVADGYFPQDLTYHHGNLYGTTLLGGTRSGGTVFELTRSKSEWTEKVIHSFGSGTDATQPVAAVVFDGKGNLYGSASKGGNSACNNQGCGAIFELTPNGNRWTEKILHRFTGGTDGAAPNSTPILRNSRLLGVTSEGGANGNGVVFELTL